MLKDLLAGDQILGRICGPEQKQPNSPIATNSGEVLCSVGEALFPGVAQRRVLSGYGQNLFAIADLEAVGIG